MAEHNEQQMQCRGEPGGRSERLGTRLQGRYREGLSYQEAEQLCLRMYYNFESTESGPDLERPQERLKNNARERNLTQAIRRIRVRLLGNQRRPLPPNYPLADTCLKRSPAAVVESWRVTTTSASAVVRWRASRAIYRSNCAASAQISLARFCRPPPGCYAPRTSRTLWVLPSSTSGMRVWEPEGSVSPFSCARAMPRLTPRGLSIRIS